MDTLARLTLEHRRLLAALFAGLAVLTAVNARADGPSTSVVVAARPLSSGTVLTAEVLRTVEFPTDLTPDQPLEVSDLEGRRVSGPMGQGEPFTPRRILEPTSLDGFGRDAVLASVRIAEADAVSTIRVGDVIDLVAVDPHGEHEASVVARGVTIVTVPAEVDDDRDVTIRIATDEPTALALASAALTSRFSVLLARHD